RFYRIIQPIRIINRLFRGGNCFTLCEDINEKLLILRKLHLRKLYLLFSNKTSEHHSCGWAKMVKNMRNREWRNTSPFLTTLVLPNNGYAVTINFYRPAHDIRISSFF